MSYREIICGYMILPIHELNISENSFVDTADILYSVISNSQHDSPT